VRSWWKYGALDWHWMTLIPTRPAAASSSRSATDRGPSRTSTPVPHEYNVTLCSLDECNVTLRSSGWVVR